MNKKLAKLSRWSFLLALLNFALAYVMFHYLTDSGFTAVWQPEAGKPLVTYMVAGLGVLFLFASIMSQLLRGIVFSGKEA